MARPFAQKKRLCAPRTATNMDTAMTENVNATRTGEERHVPLRWAVPMTARFKACVSMRHACVIQGSWEMTAVFQCAPTNVLDTGRALAECASAKRVGRVPIVRWSRALSNALERACARTIRNARVRWGLLEQAVKPLCALSIVLSTEIAWKENASAM